MAKRLGVDMCSIVKWMRQTYGVKGRNLSECIQANESYARIDAPSSLRHRYLTEDVPTGLVPVEAIGKECGLPMTLTSMVIDLASKVVGEGFRKTGRRLSRRALQRGMGYMADAVEGR